jgi:hypothetical protein
MDERTRWLTELAARSQRRTSSSFVEWAVNEVLRVTPLRESESTSFLDAGNYLWDVDEPDRIMKLAVLYPELLDFEEQRAWKVIRECSAFWRRYDRGAVSSSEGSHTFRVDANGFHWNPDNSEDLILPLAREHWETIVAVARGELDASALPTREPDGRDHAWREDV